MLILTLWSFYHIGNRWAPVRASDTIHVSPNGLLMRRHTSRRWLFSNTSIRGWLSFISRYNSLFPHTLHLISITDLSVGVLTCMQTFFVLPWRLIQGRILVETSRSHGIPQYWYIYDIRHKYITNFPWLQQKGCHTFTYIVQVRVLLRPVFNISTVILIFHETV